LSNLGKERFMKKNNSLGERRIVQLIEDSLEHMPEMPIPFGDDVAAYDLGEGKLAVLKADMLVGKTDVPPGMSVFQAARKAVVMNVSDFAAKGVKPLAALISLGLPSSITKKEVIQIGKGLNSGAREYDTYIVGGDTGEASDLIVSVMLFGLAEKGKMALRSGAKPNDILAVTGQFGNTSSGLKLLINGFKAARDIRKRLTTAVYMPRARLREGLELAQSQSVSASIDSSDGLAWSLCEIMKESNVGFMIDRIPASEETQKFAEMNNLDPLDLVFYGGEEYELVVTIRPNSWKKAESAVQKTGGRLIRIGRVTSGKEIIVAAEGRKKRIEPKGYEHFVGPI
jgi:thiamine-monophosphate kinase